jgi:mRNA interferase RelE/StbE
MPAYKVELLDRQVNRQLDRIHEPDFSRLAAAILRLEDDPRPPGCRKLRGREGWRIRVGRWRVIYHINDQERLVTIVDVKPRREDTYTGSRP